MGYCEQCEHNDNYPPALADYQVRYVEFDTERSKEVCTDCYQRYWEAGQSWQQNPTWCSTGAARRRRRDGTVVEVHDPAATPTPMEKLVVNGLP